MNHHTASPPSFQEVIDFEFCPAQRMRMHRAVLIVGYSHTPHLLCATTGHLPNQCLHASHRCTFSQLHRLVVVCNRRVRWSGRCDWLALSPCIQLARDSWMHTQLRARSCTHSIKQHQSPAKRSQLTPWLACDCLANSHLPRVLAPSARSTTHIWCRGSC